MVNIQTKKQQKIIELGHKNYAPNYKPRNVVFDLGQGSYLWDVDGNRYLDLGSGIGVNCLGHQNPEILNAMHEQSRKLWHTSNVYFSEPPVLLANKITEQTFADRVFFCNSGAEANEAAIKVARKYGHEVASGSKKTIVTFKGSFHGRTIGALSATAQPKYHKGFEPLTGGYKYCEFNDIDELEEIMNENVGAVMLEPIQGESGIRPFSTDFLKKVRQICDSYDALLIFDEIQCGMGRTGRLFAYQWAENVIPDIVTVAKAFGGGLPIGATLLGPKLSKTLSFGSHGSTFGGNPICCAVANVIIEKVCSTDFLDQVTEKGLYFKTGLTTINNRTGLFKEIRGKGLMIGAEFKDQKNELASKTLRECLKKGLLVLQSGANVIRFLPPFTITTEEIENGLNLLEEVLVQIKK